MIFPSTDYNGTAISGWFTERRMGDVYPNKNTGNTITDMWKRNSNNEIVYDRPNIYCIPIRKYTGGTEVNASFTIAYWNVKPDAGTPELI